MQVVEDEKGDGDAARRTGQLLLSLSLSTAVSTAAAMASALTLSD